MSKGLYKCESCMVESSRRWNINRHIRIVHKGNALAFNRESGKVSNLSAPSLGPINKELIPFIYDSSIYENEQEFPRIELDLNLSMNNEVKAIMSIYEELSKQIDALEELVSSNQINGHQISAFLMYALLTENPIHTLDELIRLVRFRRAKHKVISYASKFLKKSPLDTDTVLSTLIKDTQYYKRMSHSKSI